MQIREALGTENRISLCTSQGSKKDFYITKLVGLGATCIVYEGYYKDDLLLRHYVRIKECFPLDGTNTSRVNGNISWKDEVSKNEAFERFERTYRQHVALQASYEFVNVTCKITDELYRANDTLYFIMELDNGKPFNEAVPNDICDVLKVIKALTNTINKYHEIGFLHLDIKPNNFMTIPETPELVKLFDFDSLVPMDEVSSGVADAVSYTNEWAAPEVRQGKSRKIGRTADVYSVGAVLYYALFGEMIKPEDCAFLGNLNFGDNKFFNKRHPRLKIEINQLFKRTLCALVNKRYQSLYELETKLDELIELANPKKKYIINRLPNQNNIFIGRTNELLEVDKLLENTNRAIIYGIGGVGKSELSAAYLERNKDKYDQIVWAKVDTSVADVINDKNIICIANDYGEDEDRLKKIKSVITNKTIIVFDDVKDFSEPLLSEILKLDCKVILTTRIVPKFAGIENSTFELTALSAENIKSLFYSYYTLMVDETENAYVDKIIEQLSSHTMLVALTAKQMQATSLLPSKMYDFMKNKNNTSFEAIYHSKDNDIKYLSLYEHLSVLFSVSNLDEDEKACLRVMSIFYGISIGKTSLAGIVGFRNIPSEFVRKKHEDDIAYKVGLDCGVYTFGSEKTRSLNRSIKLDKINSLIKKGWLSYDEKLDRVCIHNVISDWVDLELKHDLHNCKYFWGAIEFMASDIWAGIKYDEFDFQTVGDEFGITPYECNEYEKIIVNALKKLDLSVEDNIIYVSNIINDISALVYSEIHSIIGCISDHALSNEAKLKLLQAKIICSGYEENENALKDSLDEALKIWLKTDSLDLQYYEVIFDHFDNVYYYYDFCLEPSYIVAYVNEIKKVVEISVDSEITKFYRVMVEANKEETKEKTKEKTKVCSMLENRQSVDNNDVSLDMDEMIINKLFEDIYTDANNDAIECINKYVLLDIDSSDKLDDFLPFYSKEHIDVDVNIDIAWCLECFGKKSAIFSDMLYIVSEVNAVIFSNNFCGDLFTAQRIISNSVFQAGTVNKTDCLLHIYNKYLKIYAKTMTCYSKENYLYGNAGFACNSIYALSLLDYDMLAIDLAESMLELCDEKNVKIVSFEDYVYIVDQLINISKKINDGYMYYKYKNIKKSITHVDWEDSGETAQIDEIGEKSISSIYFDYLKRIENTDSLDEKEDIMLEVDEDSRLNSNMKSQLFQMKYAYTELDTAYFARNDKICKYGNPELVKSCIMKLETASDIYSRLKLISEIVYQMVKNEDHDVSVYLDLLLWEMDKVTTSELQVFYINVISRLPIMLDRLGYNEVAYIVAQKIKDRWLPDSFEGYAEDIVYWILSVAEPLYNILIDNTKDEATRNRYDVAMKQCIKAKK